jgi:group I intron endonuclease
MMFRTKYDGWYFIVYKTTNQINGLIYVGQRRTKDLNDGYLGSGLTLLKAIKKYGKRNFYREILEFCKDKQHLNESEMFWIKELNARDRGIGYNIGRGGEGCQLEHQSEESNRKNSEHNKGKPGWSKGLTKETDPRLAQLSETCMGRTSGMKGKFHTEKSKEKSKISQTGKHVGEKNSFYKKQHTPETKQYIRELRLNAPIQKCIWCGFESKSELNMKRWHGDNCKQNPANIDKVRCNTVESNNKRRLTMLDKPIEICPYCGFQSRNHGSMVLYHFDNCKQNPNKIYVKRERRKESTEKQKETYNNLPFYICIYCGHQSRNRGAINYWHNNNCKHKIKTA